MEHLTRNTHNDRLIYAIESTKKESQIFFDKNIKDLIDKIVNILTGLLSSITSACIISIIKDEQKLHFNTIGALIIFLGIVILLWFIAGKWVIPFFYKLFYKKPIDITPDTEIVAVHRFNTEMMQKIAEITEIVGVIKETNETECKTLNYVISLYKLQEVTNFMYQNFYVDPKKVRRAKSDGSAELIRYSFNIYTVTAVLDILNDIRKEMEKLSTDDPVIKKLNGIELLKEDLSNIKEKLEKVKF